MKWIIEYEICEHDIIMFDFAFRACVEFEYNL